MPDKGYSISKYLLVNILVSSLASLVVALYLIPLIYQPPLWISGNRQLSGGDKVNPYDLANDLRTRLIMIYPKKDGITLAGRVYLDEERLALGTAVTSDGWAVTYGLTAPKESLVAATRDHQVLAITDMFTDPATGLVFFKTGAQNLAVSGLAEQAKAGDKVVMLDPAPVVTDVRDLAQVKAGKNNFIFSSETYPYLYELSTVRQANGAPVFNFNGELLGLSIKDGDRSLVKPLTAIGRRLDSLLGAQVKERTFLGVNYIDLSRWSVNFKERRVRQSGAMIVDARETGGIAGVVKNSPAEKAGLQPGQIITQVDGQDLSLRQNLSDYILGLKPGQEVDLTVLQSNGQEIKVKVVLGKI